jgi:hypothetical protein
MLQECGPIALSGTRSVGDGKVFAASALGLADEPKI